MSGNDDLEMLGVLEPKKPKLPFFRKISNLLIDCSRLIRIAAFVLLGIAASLSLITSLFAAKFPVQYQWSTDKIHKFGIFVTEGNWAVVRAEGKTGEEDDPLPDKQYFPPDKPQPFHKSFEGYVFYQVSTRGNLTKQGKLGKDGKDKGLPSFMELKPGDLLRAHSWINVRVGPDKNLRVVNVMRIFECVRVLDKPIKENISSSRSTRIGGWIRVEHADCKPLYE